MINFNNKKYPVRDYNIKINIERHNVNIRCEEEEKVFFLDILVLDFWIFLDFGIFRFLIEQIFWDLNLTSNSNFNQIVMCRLARRLESLGGGDGRGADTDQL